MGAESQLESQRERIERGDELSDADREVLLELDDILRLNKSKYSTHRHLKLIRNNRLIAEGVGGLADALEDRDAAEDILRWIHAEKPNEETNKSYRVCLKMCGRLVSDENGDEPPDSLAWISSTTSSNHDPRPDPSDMVKWDDEVQAMLEAAQNSRDKAAIAVQFDAGLRGGEFKSLTIGDVTDHRHGLQVTVEGKTGQRTVTLIISVPHLQRWLADHPRSDDPDAPLWCNLSDGSSISHTSLLAMFKAPAERAGVHKPVTLTAMRKSSASYLASKGMRQPHLEDHHGWVRGSRVAARYISVFAEDADRELAKVHGKELDVDEDEPRVPEPCPRCGERTPREKPLCMWCGQALEVDAAERVEQLEDLITRAMAQSVGEEAESWRRLHKETRDDPEARAEALDRLSGMLDID